MGIILLGTGSWLAKACERAGERKAAVVSQTIDPGVFQVLAIRFASTIGEPYTGPSCWTKKPFRFVNFVLFTRDRILTNETQSNCFIPLSYSLIYIGCVKSYSAKFVRNHSLIRYSLHCDWLLPSTDLKGHSRLRWLCKPINVHNVHTHHLTCVTHESKSLTP